MKVSCAISTYEAGGKGADLLRVNLEHIFNQSYQNVDIVISDHSKDDKIADLVALLRESSPFPIIYEKFTAHYGSSSANQNHAIDMCTGDLIKIIFMDDYLSDANALQAIVDAFQDPKNANKKWLVSSYIHSYNYKDVERPTNPRYISNLALGNNLFGCPTALTIHRMISERFDINLKWLMDCEYYERLYRVYGPPIYLGTITAVNFLHPNQVTNTAITQSLIDSEKRYVSKKLNI